MFMFVMSLSGRYLETYNSYSHGSYIAIQRNRSFTKYTLYYFERMAMM